MATRRHECFTAECDTPGCEPWKGAEFTPHYDSPEAAVTGVVDEWEWGHKDGVLRCSDCAALHECEQDGHDWQPGHTDEALKVRQEYCGRCHGASRLFATT
ncbi:hypothetical protein [Nocardiopsis tropica]|uniref:HNH endonuclease n=1 Tax=Nocardiopsis tropica TaxID=109330 RepID=A0ABU7KZN6_9ACTN|nr:hypothetical protein [Nocardiopsis umidischolae]MEE2054771.1 hypothetical protein [Nocardiopsis umidischolae]